MKHRRILSALLFAVLLVSLCTAAASAAEENYDTFDYRAYANIYPDLKAAYSYDAAKLYAHYVNYGKAEGRIGTFISGDNPKLGAPIYGNTPAPADGTATIPATLLIPLPPASPMCSPARNTQAVAWAMSQGITGGTGNNQFSPAQTCTRGQIVTFLYRAFAG